jgi:NAD(P)-dependent dehydrogenase (short-subunit alcohol dehydrogenase family)
MERVLRSPRPADHSRPWGQPLSEWRRLFDVNLFGHIATTQALLTALIESRGTIVNITSVGGKVAIATYATWKIPKMSLLLTSAARNSNSNVTISGICTTG